MFTKEKLLNDNRLKFLISQKLYDSSYQIGRFTNIYTVEEFIDRLLLANLEKVKHLPKSKLLVFRTSDLGTGYRSSLSSLQLKEYISLNKIDENTPVHFEYKLGNVFTYIIKKDININLLLTNDIYFFIDENTFEIYDIVIGQPTKPNFLYYQSHLTNFTTTLKRALTVQYLNRIDITEGDDTDLIF